MDVTGISVAKAQEIEDASIVAASINPGTGHLEITNGAGSVSDAGQVVPDTSNMVVDGAITGGHLILEQEDGGTIDAGAIYSQPVPVQYDASSSFLKASYPGATRVKFHIWAGGGSGAGGVTLNGGGGGGGGGFVETPEIPVAKLGTTVNITVGAGATPGAAGAIGTIGGSSVVYVTPGYNFGAGGGGGGWVASTANYSNGGGGGGANELNNPAAGGTPVDNVLPGAGGGKMTWQGGPGGRGSDGSPGHFGGGGGAPHEFYGGGSVWGGGGGAPGTKPSGSFLPTHGVSYFGGNGGIRPAVNVAGNAGSTPGGGGSGGGGGSATVGGAGAPGRVIAYVYYD